MSEDKKQVIIPVSFVNKKGVYFAWADLNQSGQRIYESATTKDALEIGLRNQIPFLPQSYNIQFNPVFS